MNITSESKKLAIELRAKEELYVTGELDLNETLDETDRLFKQVQRKTEEGTITANEIMPDSHLIKIQTGLAKRSAKFYKPDSLVFNPTEFSLKLKLFYDQSTTQNDSESSQRSGEQLWLQLGNMARKMLYTVPSFNFIHGTFDPDPIEVVKKKRKMKEKDKLGALTKPQSMSLKESSENKDSMIAEASRLLGYLEDLHKKKEGKKDWKDVGFYEFVVDPESFGQTIENIFIISLLANENCVLIYEENGLPFLSFVTPEDRKEKLKDRNRATTMQSILSISHEEWKNIVKTFKITKRLFRPKSRGAS